MTRAIVDVHLQPDGRVFVFTYSRDTAGFWVSDGLPVVLGGATDPETLGAAALAALATSTEGVVPARDLRANPPDQQLLAWVGVNTYAQYARGVRSAKVHAFYDDNGALNRLLVTPETNHGRDGFTPDVERRQEVAVLDAYSIGNALMQALDLARAS
ncbi:hypothetical protein GCM10027058_29420 [Microbacterium neimengense]